MPASASFFSLLNWGIKTITIVRPRSVPHAEKSAAFCSPKHKEIVRALQNCKILFTFKNLIRLNHEKNLILFAGKIWCRNLMVLRVLAAEVSLTSEVKAHEERTTSNWPLDLRKS